MVKIHHLIDDIKCYQTVREMRWPDGVRCAHCQSGHVIKRGRDDTQHARQRYHCKACRRDFDDLIGSIFATSYRPGIGGALAKLGVPTRGAAVRWVLTLGPGAV